MPISPGIILSNAVLEGASFRRCDMVGANLEGARLRNANLKSANLCEAFLSGADLRDANLDNADLEGANLQRTLLTGANLSRANLEGANLQGANLAGARLTHAQLDLANLGGADCTGAVLTHADLGECYLGGVKMMKLRAHEREPVGLEPRGRGLHGAPSLADAQLRSVKARGVKLVGAILTKVDLDQGEPLRRGPHERRPPQRDAHRREARRREPHGRQGLRHPREGRRSSPASRPTGSTTARTPTARCASSRNQILAVLTGQAPARPADDRSANRRYFGRGDVLRNASLQFDEGATVEIESLFEQCTIALGRGTELIVGSDGVLHGCQITGAGNITINGKFFDKPEGKKNARRHRRCASARRHGVGCARRCRAAGARADALRVRAGLSAADEDLDGVGRRREHALEKRLPQRRRPQVGQALGAQVKEEERQ